jgi:hypothetical protein
MLPRPLLNFSVVPVTLGSCLFPWLLIVAGWPLGEPSGQATHRKFSDAARRLAEEIGQGGKTGAEQLAGHCFRQALKGSARTPNFSWPIRRASQSRELNSPNGSEVELDARLKALQEKYQ